MKKEIMNLINSEEGTFRLNNISILRRWTKNALKDDVDVLRIEFDTINNVSLGIRNFEIKSRDYEGIILECQEITSKYLLSVSDELCKNIRSGYRNKRGS